MHRQAKRLVAALVVLGLAWLARQTGLDPDLLRSHERPAAAQQATSAPSLDGRGAPGDSDALRRVEQAFARRESGFMITLEARVAKILRDDRDGSRHQRFLIELENGRTLLVAHNIDLAERIAVRENDRVRVRGQYEWNEQGGLLHWTHHDPQQRRAGGWIESGGTRVE